ncbi:MAG: ABC transporter ATP-binding protein [Vicinamibacterales bacterium]
MVEQPAVRLHGVGKKFTVRHRRPAGLKDHALSWLRGSPMERGELWALRDVSLSVAGGEMLGVVGANGSGKSTLLQLIAGIYEPDAGTVDVRGRVRAILELGAGFNPELSGRDNVFLSGALLDMTRAEVRRRFDEIVAFAEIEGFIDMPLKTYSSGMQLRLAFATAAHFDPDVLLLDEVLAVGDAAFQRKCLGRIRDVRKSGAAIVFISHDLVTVEQMCDRAATISDGRLVDEGPPVEVVSRYRSAQALGTLGRGAQQRWGTGEVRLLGVRTVDAGGQPAAEFCTGEPMTVRLEYEATAEVRNPVFGLAIRRDDGTLVTGPNTKMSGCRIQAVSGRGSLEYVIARLPLLPGVYWLAASVYDEHLVNAYDHWERCAEFVVAATATRERFGLVTLGAEWRT